MIRRQKHHHNNHQCHRSRLLGPCLLRLTGLGWGQLLQLRIKNPVAAAGLFQQSLFPNPTCLLKPTKLTTCLNNIFWNAPIPAPVTALEASLVMPSGLLFLPATIMKPRILTQLATGPPLANLTTVFVGIQQTTQYHSLLEPPTSQFTIMLRTQLSKPGCLSHLFQLLLMLILVS